MPKQNNETAIDNFFKSWHVKLSVFIGILVPTVTAVGAFYDIKSELNERMSQIELQSQKQFADKETLKEILKEQSVIKEQLVEIKTILKGRNTR